MFLQKKNLCVIVMMLNFAVSMQACHKAFGSETRYESKSQPVERLGNLVLLKSTTTFEWSDLACNKEAEVYTCQAALEPSKNIFIEKDMSPPAGSLRFPEIDGVLFVYERNSHSLALKLYYRSRPELSEEALNELAKETFEKSSDVLKKRTFMLMVYE